MSDPGCVSADTEFLTPSGWKRIDQYTVGDRVAQFDPATRAISWIAPLDYVKAPCSELIAIEPVRGTSQRLSAEHRVLYYTPDGEYAETSAADFMSRLHRVGANHNRRKFACTFNVNRSGIDLKDSEIRLMIAVIADGHFPYRGAKCTVRLKKRRKIERLRSLLVSAGVQYVERSCGSQTGFQVFRFKPPREEKYFSEYWWSASQGQLYVIADELPHWDGSVRKANGVSFCSTVKPSAEFAQYVFAATGSAASVTYNVRTDKTSTYDVHAVIGKQFVGPGRAESVCVVDNPEGFKYCFTTETSYWLARHNGYIFATGNTGKTRVHVEVYTARKNRKRLLVVCPKTLMSSAWGADIERFAPELTVSYASAEQREAAFKMKTDVVIINTDGVKWFCEKNKPEQRRRRKYLEEFDHLIIDELTAFKHRTSARSKAMLQLRTYFERRYGLTGTPTANSVMEMWHQALILDDGKHLGTSYYAMQTAMQESTQVGPDPKMVRWDDKPAAAQVVSTMLDPITIRHKFEDVMTHVPANHRSTREFTLSPSALKAYLAMENECVLFEEGKLGAITAVHAAAKRTKLLQIASGAVYDGGPESSYRIIDKQRYELITELVDSTKHSIVFFNWKHQRDELAKQISAADMTFAIIDGSTPDRVREQIVIDYQAGRYRTLLLHPRTGAHGLTLTRGTLTIISSPIYEADMLKQGIHRIYRGDQRQVTNTILVQARNTVEDLVYARLDDKTGRMDDFLGMVKNRVK